MNCVLKTVANMSIALATMSAVAAHADVVSVSAELFGWRNIKGEGNGANYYNNTFTGNTGSYRYNSWVSFTLPTFSGPVTGVSLNLFVSNYRTYSAQTINIFDVSTPLSMISSYQVQLDVYNDLMSGKQYGSFEGFQGDYNVSFSQAAFADIFNAGGSTFIIGFTNATTNALPVGSENGIYTNGNGGPVLTITTGQSVPEPGTVALFGLGLLGATVTRRTKKAHKA